MLALGPNGSLGSYPASVHWSWWVWTGLVKGKWGGWTENEKFPFFQLFNCFILFNTYTPTHKPHLFLLTRNRKFCFWNFQKERSERQVDLYCYRTTTLLCYASFSFFRNSNEKCSHCSFEKAFCSVKHNWELEDKSKGQMATFFMRKKPCVWENQKKAKGKKERWKYFAPLVWRPL